MIARSQCQHCDGRIEFDAENHYTGIVIPCPHCGADTELLLAAAADNQTVQTLPPIIYPPTIQGAHRRRPNKGARVIAFIAIFIAAGFSLLLLMTIPVDTPSGQARSAEKIPSFERMQQMMREAERLRVIRDQQVYTGDQAWVYVSSEFYWMPIQDKQAFGACVYHYYRIKNQTDQVIFMDAHTGKRVAHRTSSGFHLE